ncbi:hypothetical protein Q5H93_03750 [Hymenobacter sp. ASUV-10]|uniref:PIN domain-containing protein n=1 Tax=Hymenobacter aranciens TaxID=3063996 RepID=A0ABT9B800_9BACT|nr:hypothetical protein [Hymenobacter sp. ASUV-10]MDO7873834.1 hypothetical protein [Hymenobacter sp. ASUV-10]
MHEVLLIDTSVFCRILRVEHKCTAAEHAATLAELEALIVRPGIITNLLLPAATIYETGNHIAQNGNGTERRKAALRFVKRVQQAFDGQAPWTPTELPGLSQMRGWLAEFPDRATMGVGLGDLSIIKTFEDLCGKTPNARVRIWSLDHHLSSYDRQPTGSLAG